MKSDWSLSSELRRLSGESNDERALRRLGMLGESERLKELIGDEKWIRGGAETYLYQFVVVGSQVGRRRYLIKACVALGVGGPDVILEEWIRRRHLLEADGVSVPALYYHGQGVLLEEFIVKEFFPGARGSVLNTVQAAQLGHYCGVLDRHGFAPIDAFADLRSRGDDLVAIDFGEDLGPPGLASDAILLGQLRRAMEGKELVVNASAEAAIVRGYQSAFGRPS